MLCLVPRDLAPTLLEPLRRHYAADPTVEVVVENRTRQRRSGPERRGEDTGPPPGTEERRLIRNQPDKGGRRVADRRATLVPVDPPRALPRQARPHADRIAFYERVEPSPEKLEDLDTARLVTRIQAGERQLFAQIYERYFDPVYAYLRVLLRDSHQAEDLTQQSFLEALEALPAYERRKAPFRAWLFTLVRNNALSHLRVDGRTESRAEVELDEVPGDGVMAEQELPILNWITDGDLMLFVERLPLAQRQVLMLRFMVGCSSAEIAEILGRSPEAVRVQQSRALAYLRQRLTAVGRGPARRRTPALGIFRQATVLRLRRFALSAPGRTG